MPERGKARRTDTFKVLRTEINGCLLSPLLTEADRDYIHSQVLPEQRITEYVRVIDGARIRELLPSNLRRF
jgi:hypothetical protein